MATPTPVKFKRVQRAAKEKRRMNKKVFYKVITPNPDAPLYKHEVCVIMEPGYCDFTLSLAGEHINVGSAHSDCYGSKDIKEGIKTTKELRDMMIEAFDVYIKAAEEQYDTAKSHEAAYDAAQELLKKQEEALERPDDGVPVRDATLTVRDPDWKYEEGHEAPGD